jgi:hypothetical protein
MRGSKATWFSPAVKLEGWSSVEFDDAKFRARRGGGGHGNESRGRAAR